MKSRDFLVEHSQIVPIERGGFVRPSRLNENLHAHQRIVQFVSQAGRKLPECGELIGAKHLAMSRMEFLDHRIHFGGNPLEHRFKILDRRILIDLNRSDYLIEPPGHIAKRNAQLKHGAPNSPGQRITDRPACRRPADA